MQRLLKNGSWLSCLLVMAACVPAQNAQSPAPFTGSAGGAVSVDAPVNNQRCPSTVGTIAVDSGEEKAWYARFTNETKLNNIMPLIENTILQSNCFQITSQGSQSVQGALNRIGSQQQGGQFRPGTAAGPNQRIGSDYYLDTTVSFSGTETSTANLGIVGALAGSVRQGTAQVTLRLFDVRAQVLIGSAVGEGKQSSVGGILGTGANPAAKAVALAINDAYGKLVPAIVNYRPQTIAGGAGAGGNLPVK